MTNQERKERRREAALKGARTRAERQADAQVEPVAPTAREILDRARALGIRRERDLYRCAHELRAGHRPADWTPRVRLALAAAVELWEAKR